MPNEGSRRVIKEYVVTVDAVEKATGLDFFYKLNDEIENKLEQSIDIDAWKWGYNQRSYSYSSSPQNKEKKHSEAESLKYWVTYKSGTIHNKSCRWYKNSTGYPTNKPTGRLKNCSRCGGMK